MASEDVIHSFFVPAFRVKHDVVPGTLQTIWFKANKTGTFKLECTQYCGLQHATMTSYIGRCSKWKKCKKWKSEKVS